MNSNFVNTKLSLIVMCAVAVAGWTWAALPVAQDPAPKPATPEVEIEKLKGELATLKEKHEAQLVKQRSEIDFLMAWVKAQAEAGTALQGVLDDARDKGFTAGINPDSRVALLAGFDSFAESLKSGLPATPAEDADASASQTRGVTPPRKQ